MLISAHKELTHFLKHPTNLHWLNLSQCHVAPGRRNTIDPGQLLEMTELLSGLTKAFETASPKNLSINTRHFDLNSFSAIANALAVPKNHLRTLELSTNSPAQGCEITPAMMRVLVEGLKKSPSLRELSLKNHYISSRAAKILAEALPHTNLTVCDLTDCGIKKTGLSALLRALPETKLVYLGMHGSHYRTILKSRGLYGASYGSVNLTGSKALRRAVENKTNLAEVEMPMDHYVSHCQTVLREGKGTSEDCTIRITKIINEAQQELKQRVEELESIAYKLFNQRPLHLNSRLINFLEAGGDQAVRHVLKTRILHKQYHYSFICSSEMEKKLNGLMGHLQQQIAHYKQSAQRSTVFAIPQAAPLPVPNATSTSTSTSTPK